MEGNHISEVTWDSPYHEDLSPPALEELALKSNKIETVPTETLRHLKNLKSLDLSGNLISSFSADCMKGLESLMSLYLNSLPNLEVVNDFAFAELKALTTLEIHSNRKLKSIGTKAFLALPMLKSVDLHANALTTLNVNTFEWSNLEKLDLRFNDWQCDCHIQWMIDVLRGADLNSSQLYTSETYCASPEQLASKRLTELKADNLQCASAKKEVHKFEDHIMLAIFVSFSSILIVVLIALLYRNNYFQCFHRRRPNVPHVNYHANIHPMLNGHCNVIAACHEHEDQRHIADNEVHQDDDLP